RRSSRAPPAPWASPSPTSRFPPPPWEGPRGSAHHKEKDMKRSKAHKDAAAKIDRTKLYTPAEAAKLAKETSTTKFDATVEVALRLGVDPRKADQIVRGTVN